MTPRPDALRLARYVLRAMREDDELWFAKQSRHILPVQAFVLASDREWRIVKVTNGR